jgi:4-diphosphocytidyl-2-C-methyl-D-erythritol kinase
VTRAGTYPAPAKLNLMLRVTGRRADGYHLLQSVFRFIDYADTLTIRVREDGAIVRTNELPGVAPEADLTVRAARLLQAATGIRRGCDLGLDKRLPMGAGLGGGSSDAATVLLALNDLWGTGLKRGELQALGLQLGADVPVFLYGQTAWAEGVGEVLSPLDVPPAWYVVLTPPVSVPTREIFADPELTRDSIPLKIRGFSAGGAENTLNSLTPVVCRRYPVVAEWLSRLGAFAPARMTGSGSSIFAAFDAEIEARRVLAALEPELRGFVARGLDRHPLYGMAGN